MKHSRIKRPLVPALIFTVAGTVACLYKLPLPALAAPVVAEVFCYFCYRRSRYRKKFFIQIFFFFLLFLVGYFTTYIHDNFDNIPSDSVILSAKVEKVVEGAYSRRLMLENCVADGRRLVNDVVLEVQDSKSPGWTVSEGDSIEVEARLAFPDAATNPGQFDLRQYYKSLGYLYYIKNPEITCIKSGKNLILKSLKRLKRALKKVYSECCTELDAGVYEAMVIGDRSDMDGSLKGLFSAAGIGHILAISGVKTLKLDIPLVLEPRINWAFVALHIAIIYILKLCLDEEIIPRCRFPCSRGYLTKYINWQKK